MCRCYSEKLHANHLRELKTRKLNKKRRGGGGRDKDMKEWNFQ